MSVSTLSAIHRAVRNQASITLADTGAGAATLRLYSAPGGTLLATRRLAKPCGVITTEGRIQLLPDTSTIDLVAATGNPSWAQWCDGDGVAIWSAEVTDAAGAGPFKLAGTDPGNPTLTLYAGGVVELTSPALLG